MVTLDNLTDIKFWNYDRQISRSIECGITATYKGKKVSFSKKYFPEELFKTFYIQTHLTYLSFNMTYST